jgi:sugar (pentulose or hexulose) kinase
MPGPEQRYFLSIDNGTQSVRALVFDVEGNLVAKSQVVIEPYTSPEPGWAEQDPEYFWQSLCEACEALWPMLPFGREQLAAVSVTTQRATVLPLDVQGKAVRPAISWLDQRQVQSRPALGLWRNLLFTAVGAKPLINRLHAEAEANWIAQHQPKIWDKVDKYLFLSGYHNYRLTGQYSDAVASQVGYVPFDFKRLRWASDGDWPWQVLPVLRSMLPQLQVAGSRIGEVTELASSLTGIPAGLPVIASGSDKACEVLGSGCMDSATGSLSYGTTATFNITSSKYLEAQTFQPPYPGVVPGSYNVESFVPRGYWMVNWFKREFGLQEKQLGEQKGVAPEQLFDQLLASVPAGSMGLVMQPYWSSPGGKVGAEAKGAFVGFGDVHTRAHVYRAMIEGISYALREGKELLEKRSGTAISCLRVSGGGSQSDEVMQITADIFGMPAERPHTFETSGLGAAIACAVGMGAYPDFDSAVAAMVRPGERFTPIAKNVERYDQLYKQVYRGMYKQLRPLYRAIRSITGYPS